MSSSEDQKPTPEKKDLTGSFGNFVVNQVKKTETYQNADRIYQTGQWIVKAANNPDQAKADLVDHLGLTSPKSHFEKPESYVEALGKPFEQDGKWILVNKQYGFRKVWINLSATALMLVFLVVVLIQSGNLLLLPIIALVGYVVYAFIQRIKHVLPAELIFPHYPLRLGDDVTIQFHRPLKEPLVQPGQLRAALSSAYGKREGDKEADFVFRRLFCQELQTIDVPIGSTSLNGEWKISIPLDGIPSKEEKKETLRWYLSIVDEIPYLPAVWLVFTFEVIVG